MFPVISLAALLSLIGAAAPAAEVKPGDGGPLPGTARLELQGDAAAQMVEGIDRFLLSQTERALQQRARHWRPDFSSPAAHAKSVAPNVERLAQILGVRDLAPRCEMQLQATTAQPALVGQSDGYQVFAVRWPAFGDVHGEGLLLTPRERPIVADVVALGDCEQTPEMLAGLSPGVPPESQFARRLAESGCRVIVPVLINRQTQQYRSAKITNREYVYRAAYELGRHLIGYETAKVMAAVGFFADDRPGGRIGVFGYGDGGMLALCTGALDARIHAVGVSGYFDSRQDLWQEPLDRNVFGLLEQFGDAELAAMRPFRPLVVEAARGPQMTIPPGTGGGPGRVAPPAPEGVRREVQRARELLKPLPQPPGIVLVESAAGDGPFGSEPALAAFLRALAPAAALAPSSPAAQEQRKGFDPSARHARQFYELTRHNEQTLARSADERRRFFGRFEIKSLPQFEKEIEWYRDYFAKEVIGQFDEPLLPPQPRTRRTYDAPQWTGYEVVLDVFPDVFAYGILLVPKGIGPGERRPVVVCQHGLEGRPTDTLLGDHGAYHDYAARLAERGFVTFAPQNPYIFQDRFRTLQRKANPLKKTLFSVIVPQHRQIVAWLGQLPFVDAQRIGFYGLSYGGKSAMRIPPLVEGYCLSICSADFNEWVWKNASTGNRYSYMETSEYEIFEFNLGGTFNYAEMAALIAPRPFMVERGHFDGVAPDETVGYEFAKVRHLYQAKLGIGDRCEIEWFVGPHTINAQGTFAFLHRYLRWPPPRLPAPPPKIAD